jgi:hypothetical protein
MMARRGAYRILVGNSEERTPLRKPTRKWEDNIKMDFRELEWGSWTVLLRMRTGGGFL